MATVTAASSPPVGASSKTPSSSGRPWPRHIGSVASTGTPVISCSISGAGASRLASPRNLFSTKPRSSARSASGINAQVPYRWAKAPPRSISATSRQAACVWRATRRLTTSLPIRLISAGEPAPSITTTSFSARNASSAAAICGQTFSLRPRQGMAVSSASTCPSTTTWLRVSASGLSSSGFMRTSGSACAASAWKYCALPISPPSGQAAVPPTTRALLLMFCALNGTTRRPCRAYQRHSAVVSQLLPAPLVHPSTITQRASRRPEPFAPCAASVCTATSWRCAP